MNPAQGVLVSTGDPVPLQLTSLLGNSQRLDGGAMFGNAPRALWTRWATPDAQHRIPLSCRALLVRDGDRLILLETGIGTFFEPALRERYGVVEERHVLLDSLNAVGLGHADIDVVILSHLHFDHVGGLLAPYAEGEPPALLFPNATYLVGERAWERAVHPHPRDRASFIPGLTDLLTESGRLQFIRGERSDLLGPRFSFRESDGHTPGLVLTEIDVAGTPVVYASDLIPGTPWVHLPITMGYDRYPEHLIDEKRALLEDLMARDGRLFYTHDPDTALSAIAKDDRGRFRAVRPVEAIRDLSAFEPAR